VIGFWVAAAVLTAVTLALLLVPLVRRRDGAAPDRSDYDLSVYRDQLAEVDRDLERGVLGADQADAARLEIKRRILAAGADTESGVHNAPSKQAHRAIVAVIAVAVPAFAVAVYLDLGSPSTPDLPFAERPATPGRSAPAMAGSGASAGSMDDAITRLQQRLESDPGNVEGWMLLGRSCMTMERPAEAAEAFRRAVDGGAGPVASALFAEALVAAHGGGVTEEAAQAFEAALADNPLNPKARYYLAMARAQRGDLQGALDGWVDLVALSPTDAPWLELVRGHIARAAAELGVDLASLQPSAEARVLASQVPRTMPTQQPAPPVARAPAAGTAPGPTRADMEAAAQMSASEQSEMIRGMVERLAARLEDEPDDRDGWLRLARAYEVLGEAEKAAEAREKAEALQAR